jgi:hypothetical protein
MHDWQYHAPRDGIRSRPAKLVAYHACVITTVIFESVVVFLHNHGWIDVGDLLLILDSIFGDFGACIILSMWLLQKLRVEWLQR